MTADLRERFGVSASDAVRGRVSWRELSDLVSALLVDPSTRTCASVQGWGQPVTERWLLATVLGAIGARVAWPWDASSAAVSADDLARVESGLLERWGFARG